MSADIDAIRQRHERWSQEAAVLAAAGSWHAFARLVAQAVDDRGVLLAMVDALTAELAESRAAYDVVCREIGRMAGAEHSCNWCPACTIAAKLPQEPTR